MKTTAAGHTFECANFRMANTRWLRMESEPVHATREDSANRGPATTAAPAFAAQHYTVAEIASMWKLSEDTIRAVFEGEPDVLVFGSEKPRFGRRRYSTLRIPICGRAGPSEVV
jgi:hypothetical protein